MFSGKIPLRHSRFQMAETKKELFISYGREPETVNFVRLLKRDLEKKG